MIAVPLTEENLRAAFRRIRDFQTVHTGKDDQKQKQAFVILSDSLGVTTEMIGVISEELEGVSIDADEYLAGTLFGLMVGLIAADHGQEAS